LNHFFAVQTERQGTLAGIGMKFGIAPAGLSKLNSLLPVALLAAPVKTSRNLPLSTVKQQRVRDVIQTDGMSQLRKER
jgi:hypothetical protein